MILDTEKAALQHALDLCRSHGSALGEALADIGQRAWSAAELDRLSKEDRRLLDQFAYRYTRLQDDMGHRVIPAGAKELDTHFDTHFDTGELGTATLLRRLRSSTGNTRLHRVRGKQPRVSVGAYTSVTTGLELHSGCAIRMG